MVNVMELTSSILVMVVIRPLSFMKWVCLFGLRTAFILSITWTELVKTTIYLHLSLFWKVILWTVALITLPLRLLTAIWRERQLKMRVMYMQNELENVGWERIKLEQHLHTAIKEHKMMELILADLEDQLDKAISKIQLLQDELKEVKNENLRLVEVQQKRYWSSRSKDDTDNGRNSGFSDICGNSYEIPKWKPSLDGSDVTLHDLIKLANTLPDQNSSELLKLLKSELGMIRRNLATSEVLDQRKEKAIIQSLFCVFLSFFVGIIIWEAEDPCMPLVVALFMVVVMSLISVIQFFSTIKSKPASDAVALLSLNWFVLGTLAYPTLPRMARILAPLALRITDQGFRFVGLFFS